MLVTVTCVPDSHRAHRWLVDEVIGGITATVGSLTEENIGDVKLVLGENVVNCRQNGGLSPVTITASTDEQHDLAIEVQSGGIWRNRRKIQRTYKRILRGDQPGFLAQECGLGLRLTHALTRSLEIRNDSLFFTMAIGSNANILSRLPAANCVAAAV